VVEGSDTVHILATKAWIVLYTEWINELYTSIYCLEKRSASLPIRCDN
jgi:hypothetical protein